MIHNICLFSCNSIFSILYHAVAQTVIMGKIYIYPQNMHMKRILVSFIQPQICSHLVWVKISRSMMAAVVMLPVIGSILNRPLMPDDWME